MVKKQPAKQNVGPGGQAAEARLPPGVKLLRTLAGHKGTVYSVAFDPQGEILASGSDDKTVKLWDVGSGKLLRTLEGHESHVHSLAFDPTSRTLATGSWDNTVKLWSLDEELTASTVNTDQQVRSVAFDPTGKILASGGNHTAKLWAVSGGKFLQELGHRQVVSCVGFDPTGELLATASILGTVDIWTVRDGEMVRSLESSRVHFDMNDKRLADINDKVLAFDPGGQTLATGGGVLRNDVRIWRIEDGKLLRELEGHTDTVEAIAYSGDGGLLASKSSGDGTVRIWRCDTWDLVVVIPEAGNPGAMVSGLAFHPSLPRLATVGSESSSPWPELIHIWELDLDVLLGKPAGVAAAAHAVHHTTGKIVLVGDHSVGKSALGYRMVHGHFKEQASTHGQHFWPFPALGYTHTFTRTNQWHNNARYEVGDGLVCGFRQESQRDGELDFVLCFDPRVGPPVRTLFQGLFESFLARRNLTVKRYEPVRCGNPQCGQLLDRSVVRQRMKEGKTFAFCNDCGEKMTLPKMAEPIQLTREIEAEVELQRRTAEQRTRFEQAVFRVQAYVSEQEIKPPECFISYAWGVPEHERWVEKRLATDLQKAGIGVVLDRWHNAQIGASVARFVERIEKSDRIVMVGTPLYRRKYENKDSSTGYVVAAEVDLIANRLVGTEEQKTSVLPLLLDGEKTASLPPLLHGRVHADFCDESAYFTTAFDLILSLYQIPPNHPAVADLRESLRGPDMR